MPALESLLKWSLLFYATIARYLMKVSILNIESHLILGLSVLTCLTYLDIHDATLITEESVCNLYNLKGLVLSYNTAISDYCLTRLTALNTLRVCASVLATYSLA